MPEPNDGGDGGDDKGGRKHNPSDFVKSMLRQYEGDANAAIAGLGRDRHKATERARDAEKRLQQAEAELDRLRKPGSKVVPDAEYAEFEAFKALNVKVKDVKDALAELEPLRQFKVNTERAAEWAKAATAAGYTQPTVLLDLANLPGRELDLSFRKVKVKDEDGNEQETELPHVRKRGDDKASWTPLTEHAETQWKSYLPALTAADESRGDEEQERFTPVLGSAPASKGKAQSKNRDVVGDHLKSSYSFPGAATAGAKDQ